MSVVGMAIRRVKKIFAWILAVVILLLMFGGGLYIVEVVV